MLNVPVEWQVLKQKVLLGLLGLKSPNRLKYKLQDLSEYELIKLQVIYLTDWVTPPTFLIKPIHLN